MNIAGILLAAGQSTRFGRNKLMEPLGDQPMIMQSARNLLPHVTRLYVVLAAGQSELETRLTDAGLHTVICPNPQDGLSASLACGIRQASAHDGWLLALADMPFIQPDTYQQIVSAAALHRDLVAPVYQGKRGHPVYLHRRYREALLSLQGDTGAKSLLQSDADTLFCIDVDDPGVLRDIDTPADLMAHRHGIA